MKIVCESCGAKYSIADEKVAGKVFKIRCKKCSAVIVVKGDQPAEGADSGAFDYGSDAVWHVVVAGEQQGPFAPRQIGELLAEGKIDWEAYVWREGMDGWQPAKDVEDLVKSVMAEAEGGEAAKSAEAAPARSEVFGGSSDMGADPFASSTDDGGLSGVIGGGNASTAVAAGGGADLFADSSRSAFAGAAASDDDDHGSLSGVGGGPRVSGDSAMTGQRNENSVLFSLSNLQALATGSGAAPSGRPKPGMAQGEGSGLIDIRALASATQAVAEKPSGAQRDKIEDLLAVGSTGTTFSATSLAAPVATDRGDSNKVLLYGMAAAILALGGVVAYLAVRSSPAPVALTPAATEQERADAEEENLKVPASAAATAQKEEPTEAPQAAEPSAPAEEPAEKKEEHASSRSDKRSSRHESSSSSSSKPKEEKPEPVAAAEPKKPAPQSSADKSLDDLLNTALGGGAKKPAAAKAEPSESLQPSPTRD
ncbi:MAG: GYF domain-containing protein, partial [Polyangiales bacterium]